SNKSSERQFFLNSSTLPCCNELTKSCTKLSAVIYITRALGLACNKAFPTACIKCVLPRPVGPYKNKGLCCEAPNWVKTLRQVSAAIWLERPSTNNEKVNRGFNKRLRLLFVMDSSFSFRGRATGVATDCKAAVVVAGCSWADRIAPGRESTKISTLRTRPSDICSAKIVISSR